MTTGAHSLVPRRILCATNFSPTSLAALTAAVELARPGRAEVRVLHVVPTGVDGLVSNGDGRAEIDRNLEGFTRSVVAPGLPITRVRRQGDACAEIVEEACHEQADLVVMGRHHRSRPDRAADSVTEGVARRSPCPVLVVGTPPAVFPPRRVLCAVDLGATSAETMAHAASLTTMLGADLLVLHVEPPSARAADALPPGPRAACSGEEAERALSSLVAATGLPPDRVRRHVASGDPFPAILDAVRANGSELVVVGLHAGGVVSRQFLGSTTLHLLRHQEGALLLVPAPVPIEQASEDQAECAVHVRLPARLEAPDAAAVDARVEW